MTYYPDFFDRLTQDGSCVEPAIPEMTLLRSQETVATIGSMTGEFLDLMKTSESVPLNVIEKDDDDGDSDNLMGADLPLSSKDLQAESLAKAGQSLDEWTSDDSSYSSDTSSYHQDTSESSHSRHCHRTDTRKPKVHKAGKSATKPRVRKVYDVAVEQRVYVKYTDADVLCQRGGLANKHPGNHKYLAAKEALQVVYQATPKSGRTVVAQQLVDQVHGWGGRFLRKDGRKGWYEIHHHTARTKAGQALREDYTAEERKEKRDRYKAQKNGGEQ